MSQPLPKAIASASSTPVAAGAFVDPTNNSVVANGKLVVQLHLPIGSVAALTGGGEVLNRPFALTLDANGVPVAGQSMYGSDQYSSPSSPGYDISVFDATGNFVANIVNVSITGAAPMDITNGLSTSSGGNVGNVVVTNPTGQQTINGFPLVLENTLLGFSPASSTTADTGISRTSAGKIAIGNGAQGNATGTVNAAVYQVAGVNPVGSGPLVEQTGATIITTTLTSPAINSPTVDKITQKAATVFTITSNAAKTYYSLPANGTSQATINNTLLTGASSANNVNLLNEQNNLGVVTGTSADATLFTFTIPANTVGTGKSVHITWWINHSTGATATLYLFKVNGTTISTVLNSAVTGEISGGITLYNQGSTLFSKADDPTFNGTAVVSGPAYNSGLTGDFTANLTVTLTFNVANTNAVTPHHWKVVLDQ